MPDLRLSTAALLTLAACGGRGATDQVTPIVEEPLGSALHGTTSNVVGGNAQAFAQSNHTIETLENATYTVRMARVSRDPTSRDLRLVISDETVTLNAGYYDGLNDGSTITVGDDTYVIDGHIDLADGLFLQNSNQSFATDNGNQMQLRVARDSPDTIYELGHYVIGRETDPSYLAGLTMGGAVYEGRLFSEGFTDTGSRTVTEFRSIVQADVQITADFMGNSVSGTVSDGTYLLSTPDVQLMGGFEGTISETAMVGNGFASDLLLSNCTGDATCGEGSANVIGGVFYGAEGDRVAGIVGMQQVFEDGEGAAITFIGAGSFGTNQLPE